MTINITPDVPQFNNNKNFMIIEMSKKETVGVSRVPVLWGGEGSLYLNSMLKVSMANFYYSNCQYYNS